MKGKGLKGLFSGQEESLSRGFFPMSHWGKRLKLAKKESERGSSVHIVPLLFPDHMYSVTVEVWCSDRSTEIFSVTFYTITDPTVVYQLKGPINKTPAEITEL